MATGRSQGAHRETGMRNGGNVGFRVLGEAQRSEIHAAAMEVLEKVGDRGEAAVKWRARALAAPRATEREEAS